MTDLVHLLSTLVDKEGKILVSGLYDEVAPLTDNEKSLYSQITFDVKDYRSDVGCTKLLHNEKKEELLMHR